MDHSLDPSGIPERVTRPDRSPLRAITWQSVAGAALISSLVAGAYPYIVLKLGFGPNASVVSAFLGAMFLNVTAYRTRGQNRFLNNVIQTAGTSAASTAFMCVVAAAFGYLDLNDTVEMHLKIEPWPMFLWLTCSGMIGVVFTVIFRRHILDDPRMVFASGVAAAETIEVLDSHPSEARHKMRALGLAALASAAVVWLREGLSWLPTLYLSKPYRMGFEWSFLNIGSGLLVGLNVGLSMLLGTLVTGYIIGPWVIGSGIGDSIVRGQIAPEYWDRCQALVALVKPTRDQALFISQHCGLMQNMHAQKYFPIVVFWVMWPATALMVTATFTTLFMKWRSIMEIFQDLHIERGFREKDIPLRAVAVSAVCLTVLLAVIQHAFFQMSYLQTFVAVLASLPLMLIGMRVQGETNIGPVSAMANALQALFAVFWPTHISSNLIAAGIAGNITSQSEGMIQDYKTGRIVGSSPQILTYVQIATVPIGAAAVAIMYPILIEKYGLGGDGLVAPTGLKIANMAVLLSKGVEALPDYALIATIIAAIAGVAVSVVREMSDRAWVGWIPSVTGFGFALILPGELNIPIALGGIAGFVWRRLHRQTYDRYAITVASGMIAGEAVLGGLLIPLLAAVGVHIR